MLKKEYKSGMNSFELREEKLEETREKMASVSYKQIEHSRMSTRTKKFYRIAAAIAIILLVPTTVSAISKKGYLINAFFGNTDDTSIEKSIVTDTKAISKDGFLFKVEEYLCDNELGMGYLVYSVEREDGTEVNKNDKDALIIGDARWDIRLTSNTKKYAVNYTMMIDTYDKESTPNKIYRKLCFSYRFNTKDGSTFKKEKADIFVKFRGNSMWWDEKEVDKLIKLDTGKEFDRFIWEGTENKNHLTKITISSVGISFWGTAKTLSCIEIDKEIEADDMILHFKDGTSSKLKDLGVLQKIGDNTWASDESSATIYKRDLYFKSILDASNIKSITINGYEYR